MQNNTITLTYCVLCDTHARKHTHAPMRRLPWYAKALRQIILMVLAFSTLITMGCSAPTAAPRMTPEEFEQSHNSLALKILPDQIELIPGEVFRFPKPADTIWESHNQSVLMIGESKGQVVITAIAPGKASFGGRNVYFFNKRQTVTVIVK